MVRPVAVAVAALLVLAATAAAAPAVSDDAAPSALGSAPSALGSAPSAVGTGPSALGPAPAGPAAVPAQVAPPNTTNVLLLGDDERGAVLSPETDLSAALAADHAVTEERIARAALRERYRTADEDERAAVLSAALDRAEARATAVSAAERRSQRRYANGSRSAAETVRRLSRLDATARALDATLEYIDARAIELSATDIRSRVSGVEHRLASVRGPVRERVAAAVEGSGNESRVYLAGTESGIRLATVVGGVHYHESARVAPSDGGDDRASIEEAERRIAELYPWAWNNSEGTTVDVIGDTYRATIEHPHGSLVSYVDASSLAVVREIQRRSVEALPTGQGASTARDDFRLTVNRTYPGGPLRIAARDGDGPANATIRVDDAVVGRTGSDGVLWTVSPDGGADTRFIVTAERGDGQVSMIVQPIQPSSGT